MGPILVPDVGIGRRDAPMSNSIARLHPSDRVIQPVPRTILQRGTALGPRPGLTLQTRNQNGIGKISSRLLLRRVHSRKRLIAVGPGAPDKEGRIPTSVKAGDRVLLPGWGGNAIEVGEEEYFLFKDSEIFWLRLRSRAWRLCVCLEHTTRPNHWHERLSTFTDPSRKTPNTENVGDWRLNVPHSSNP